MEVRFCINDVDYRSDISKGIDITIPFIPSQIGPNCFYAPLLEAAPLRAGDWIGDTRQGSPVNFYNVRINPHGNGTHTECVGHISSERVLIKDVSPNGMQVAQLVSIHPTMIDSGDKVVLLDTIRDIEILPHVTTLILRTLPNDMSKMQRVYSGTNPPYIEASAIKHIVDQGILHLMVDLPSIDREEDEGLLLGHKAFWNYPTALDTKKTITEMIFVPDIVKDGLYLCQIGVLPFALDAAPSRIVLYEIF